MILIKLILKKVDDKNINNLFRVSIMNPDYHSMAMELLNSGIGDEGRLKFILECITNNKPLYKTDIRFLESTTSQLELKIQKLKENVPKENVPKKNPPKENHPRTLISDEYLDQHIEKIMDRDNSKKVQADIPAKKKSFVKRLFSR
jgi:hypothetical protein